MRHHLNRVSALVSVVVVFAGAILVGLEPHGNYSDDYKRGHKTLNAFSNSHSSFQVIGESHANTAPEVQDLSQSASCKYQEELARHKRGDQSDDLREIMGLWLEEDPMSAIEYIAREARDVEFEWIRPAVMIYLNNCTGYPAKTLVVDRLYGDTRIRENLLATALRSWAHADSASALKWLSLNAARFNDRAGAEAIGGYLGESEKPKPLLDAIDFKSIPPQVKEPLLCELMTRWSTYDLVESAEWLNRNHLDAGLDTVILSLVGNAKHRDSSFAMAWAESITNEALRSEAIAMTSGFQRPEDAVALP